MYGRIIFLLVLPVLAIANSSDDEKIANGFDASPGQLPYVASYQYNAFHYCGCTIISQYWLLTAAHCIDEVENITGFDIQRLTVVAGIINLYANDPQKQVNVVRKQFKHHGFNRNTLVNDIGLVVIWNGFTFGNSVSSISYLDIPTYSDTVVAGWGYLRSSYPEASPKLQYAIGKRIFNSECQTLIYPANAVVTTYMTCITGLYNQNETTCNGDSGGPFIQRLWYYPYTLKQIGIISWDLKPCGLRGKPSVGTLIYPYTMWIDCIQYVQNSAQCTSV
ncbi:hypothetical protein RN001_014175 [Aquatica leii]|uniref:Peptidase S1 domain-containing protein n=1 Tax=Aquatica leii TaxID=1421715 RepID=A0AAN7SP05_9COLE|nr:hypothetical protein RN001_014175 [Aquatica leii]